jgi:aminoglycoside phosphotransferase (APT) family kinase protein
VVARHGDYWARNVLGTRDSLGVVDWEHYQDEGAPFFDAFLFVTVHAAVFPWRLGTWVDPVEAFRRTFFQRNWMSRLVRDELGAWCRAHEISADLLDVFFSTFLAECVLIESARPQPESRINGVGKWQRLLQEHVRRVESAFSG